jgi:hypothetical protein
MEHNTSCLPITNYKLSITNFSARACVLASLLASSVLAAQQLPRAVRLDPVDAILEAFKTHQVVTLPGAHAGNELHALLLKLIRDPRFPALVNDVVVEFGSARYQDLADRFVRGDDIPDAELRQVWLNTTNPGTTNDNPLPEDFFRAVRALNQSLPADRRLRVLLGDPPIDWDHIRRKEDHRHWVVQRDSYPADLIRREVIVRGRRALVVYGNLHFLRKEILSNYDMRDWQAQTIVSLLEASGHKVFVIFGDGKGIETVQPDTASWPPLSVTLVKGTVLGAADFSVFNDVETRYAIRGEEQFEPIPKSEWRQLRMEDQVDAIIYLGKGSTNAPLSPSLCADPDYVKMRLARIALAGLPQGEADRVRHLCGIKAPWEE